MAFLVLMRTGLTQEQVADLFGINQTTFSRRLTSIIVALDAWVLELFVPGSIEEVAIKTHEDDWIEVMGEIPYISSWIVQKFQWNDLQQSKRRH